MYKEIEKSRPIQFERIKNQLKWLAEYYKEKGVYNRYWFIYNGNFDLLWKRIDYRNETIAPAMKHAYKTGLLKHARLK